MEYSETSKNKKKMLILKIMYLKAQKMQKYVLKVEFSLHKIAFCKGYAYKITI